MPNANVVKSQFMGKRGDPFHQFERLIDATSELREPVLADPQFYFELANQLVEDPRPDAARKILAYRIYSILNAAGDAQHSERYMNTIFDLRRSGYWIEKAFCPTESLNQSENTLFAPQPFHFGNTQYSREIKTHIENRTPDASRDALYRVITRIHEATTADIGSAVAARKSIFFEPIFGQGMYLLEALGEVHFEASDNASRHALHTENNPNSFDVDDESFFGDVQYLQMTAISQLASNRKRFQNWPDPIPEYIDMYLSGKGEKGARFLLFSYADNGPGIIEHLNRYSADNRQEVQSLSDVIDQRLTTSSVAGAGDGLSNMKEAIQSVDGLIHIQSGAHTYHFNGIDESIQTGRASTKRGTLLTFVFPA
ncbi:hypothetical protein [Phaeobacter sp. Ax4a-4a]|uniref:hypothetical protein n=1 Tax=Phaeobacter sp. Ax4a-4a TaxID=3112437 RepID=UPI003A8AF01F